MRNLPARRVFEVFVFHENQRGGIQTIAQAGRSRAILEDMAQVRVTARAQDFHALAIPVHLRHDIFLGDRLEKARPARP